MLFCPFPSVLPGYNGSHYEHSLFGNWRQQWSGSAFLLCSFLRIVSQTRKMSACFQFQQSGCRTVDWFHHDVFQHFPTIKYFMWITAFNWKETKYIFLSSKWRELKQTIMLYINTKCSIRDSVTEWEGLIVCDISEASLIVTQQKYKAEQKYFTLNIPTINHAIYLMACFIYVYWMTA